MHRQGSNAAASPPVNHTVCCPAAPAPFGHLGGPPRYPSPHLCTQPQPPWPACHHAIACIPACQHECSQHHLDMIPRSDSVLPVVHRAIKPARGCPSMFMLAEPQGCTHGFAPAPGAGAASLAHAIIEGFLKVTPSVPDIL